MGTITKKDKSQNIIKKVKKTLQKERGVLFCYLFGSRAYQNFTSKSDVDVAVYLDEKRCPDFFEKRLKLISLISGSLKKEADVVILNTAPLFLRYVVLKEGALIFEREIKKRVEFELGALNDYFDFRPILEKYHEKLLAA